MKDEHILEDQVVRVLNMFTSQKYIAVILKLVGMLIRHMEILLLMLIVLL